MSETTTLLPGPIFPESFSISECFSLACQFLKEKEGKAFHLHYKDRVLLSAYAKQVSHGKFDPNASPDVGWLDVVGSDRRSQWQALGDLTKEKAQIEFVKLLDHTTPLLRPYLEAHKKEKEERRLEAERLAAFRAQQLEEQEARLRMEEELRHQAEQLTISSNDTVNASNLSSINQVSVSTEEEIRKSRQEAQIRAALNQQTVLQFRQYAEEQHPKDPVRQEELIHQLQEQHFQQYMTQVYQQLIRHQEEQVQQLRDLKTHPVLPDTLERNDVRSEITEENGDQRVIQGQSGMHLASDQSPNSHSYAHPVMWTHKELTASKFKSSLASDKDAKLKIGPGEIVTVRVPTHEDGACIVWEFATDHYDIGFGVYFEWTIAPSDKVTVHISESSDEEDDEEGEESVVNGSGEATAVDPERGVRRKRKDDLPMDEIVPIYRRDSHEEVYCGSHQYPGRGVYLLKFDNSYSLWRSKWLYYRVYYTR